MGLPIGHLTSQWIANLVLGRLDHRLQGSAEIRGYVRYLDDFVLFADTREVLRAAHQALTAFLGGDRRLALKERATILAPAAEGLPFLGWRLSRGVRRKRPENLRRTRGGLRRRCFEFRTGRIDETQWTDGRRSVVDNLAHGSTRAWRRACFDEWGRGSLAPATASTAAGASTNWP